MAGGKLELTGKALEDFREWFRKEIPLYDFRIRGWIMGTDDFFNLPAGMQWGMLELFFEKHGVYPIIYPLKRWNGEVSLSWIIEGSDEAELEKDRSLNGYKTKAEARISVLEKACEIYNSQLTTENS